MQSSFYWPHFIFYMFWAFTQLLVAMYDVAFKRQRKNKPKPVFHLANLPLRANREKSNLIGWRHTLTTSLANHIRFLKWKTGVSVVRASAFHNNAVIAGPSREIWGPGAKFDLEALEILYCSSTKR